MFLCCCLMGFVETKKWHVFSGELLAQVMDMIGRMRRRWRPLIREENLEDMDNFIGELEQRGTRKSRIGWVASSTSSSGPSQQGLRDAAFSLIQPGEGSPERRVSLCRCQLCEVIELWCCSRRALIICWTLPSNVCTLCSSNKAEETFYLKKFAYWFDMQPQNYTLVN